MYRLGKAVLVHGGRAELADAGLVAALADIPAAAATIWPLFVCPLPGIVSLTLEMPDERLTTDESQAGDGGAAWWNRWADGNHNQILLE